MAKKNDYIAVFDSGVGGISVLRQLLKVLPNEKYLYFGDSINAPYGVRPEEEVRQLTLAAAESCAPEASRPLSLPAIPPPPLPLRRCGMPIPIWL